MTQFSLLNSFQSDALSDVDKVLFGYKNSKTADLKKLNDAKAAQKQGIDTEKIWQDTGWYNHPQAGWMYEIPTGAINSTKDGALSGAIDNPGIFRAYPSLGSVTIGRVDGEKFSLGTHGSTQVLVRTLITTRQ